MSPLSDGLLCRYFPLYLLICLSFYLVFTCLITHYLSRSPSLIPSSVLSFHPSFFLPFPDYLSHLFFFTSLFPSTYFCMLFVYSYLIFSCKTNGHTQPSKQNTPVLNTNTQCILSLPNVEQVDSNHLQRMTCRSNKQKNSSYFIF
jgi:hypothetical protein